jgi:hypothetical protein
MSLFQGVTRGVTSVVNATTAAAGAVSGAAISGVVGGLRGTAEGVRSGLSSGSQSTPAAALTLAAIGAVGLVEWPVVLVVGGAALAVRQMTRQGEGSAPDAPLRAVPPRTTPAPKGASAPTKASSAPAKPAKSTRRPVRSVPTAAKPSARKTAARTPR